ncbi:heat repeat-containing protein [Nitzschia inconspicua]|uniref:Heat repeat-containing protein n=1 Tax=Nitzschia inconspicua TaxID=303405 RepID=A0A9K3PXL6_9STRA|nr:heat repeat-containing protein [Nitzschia inconspicua]
MSRWDSLRPTSNEEKGRRIDGKLDTKTVNADEYHKLGDKGQQGRHRQKTDRNIVHSRLTPHPKVRSRKKNEEASLSSKPCRPRPRPRPRMCANGEIQRYLQEIRERIAVHFRQQQSSTLENYQGTTLFLKDIEEIQTIITTNEQCYSDVCGILLDLLEVKSENSEFSSVVVLVLEEKLRYAQDHAIRFTLSKLQAIKAVNTLNHLYGSYGGSRAASTGSHASTQTIDSNSLILCIAMLVQTQANKLPAEDTARSIVLRTFLPYLEKLQEEICPCYHEKTTRVFVSICQALVQLLHDQGHASSILAPLVQDIALNNGMECTVVNPTRVKLVSVMSHILDAWTRNVHPGSQQAVTNSACEVVTATLDSIRKLKQTPVTIVDEGSTLSGSLQPSLLSVLELRPTIQADLETRIAYIKLCRSLLACYPNCMTGIGWKLLVEDYNKYLPFFFDPSIHNSNDVVEPLIDMNIELLADVVKVLPWKRWLNQDISHKNRGTSGLFRKVTSALESLFSIVSEDFQPSPTRFPKSRSYSRLLKTLLTDIPICNDGLKQTATQLWQSLAYVIFDPSSSESKVQLAADSLVQSSGGYSSPSGEMVGMCEVGRIWFSEKREASGIFIERLFDSIASQNNGWKHSFEILVALLKTLPNVAVENWFSYRVLLERLSRSGGIDRTTLYLDILEAFASGRRDFGDDVSQSHEDFVNFACTFLDSASANNTMQIHRCILRIYSYFLGVDWRQLAEKEKLRIHLHRITMQCNAASAKLRELACKAIGEFCTQFFGEGNSAIVFTSRTIAEEVCGQLLQSSKDTHPTVRAMAIFALGNLADSVRACETYHLLDEEIVCAIVQLVVEALNDRNDKVVGNAIRCVGHAGFVVLKQKSSSAYRLAREILERLTEKLSRSLSASLDKESNVVLTWKQRSTAKKHGWGTCYSLGMILGAISHDCSDENSMIAGCAHAFQMLSLCLQHHACLNLKFVLAAMDAMCKISPTTMVLLSSNQRLIGAALCNSIELLSLSMDDKDINRCVDFRKLAQRNACLLRHLLRSSSNADARYVLLEEEISSREMNNLYKWMVEQTIEDVDARSYEIFALGLSSLSRWSDDISLEQRFASRALQMCKCLDDTGRFAEAIDARIEEIDEL